MAKFDDYHRTITGYHGTRLSTAIKIINRIDDFKRSERSYDWLGSGVYFWEYGPSQALNFAKIRQKQWIKSAGTDPVKLKEANEPLAVVAASIRLGFCLDLVDPVNLEFIKLVHREFCNSMGKAGITRPTNTRRFRKLDTAVFEFAYKLLETGDPAYGVDKTTVDSARGIYVPTDGSKRIWEGSWLSEETSIQICVRNKNCILGTWLHYPDKLEVSRVKEIIEGWADQGESESPPRNEAVKPNDSPPAN